MEQNIWGVRDFSVSYENFTFTTYEENGDSSSWRSVLMIQDPDRKNEATALSKAQEVLKESRISAQMYRRDDDFSNVTS